MGILVDMSRAKAKFSDPAYQWGALSNFSGQVQFDMHSFEIEFGASFDPDPTRGVGGASQEPELWRIGIVQNVLFEHIHLEYEGGKIFKTAFKDAAPDYKEGTMSKPFYGDPEATPGRLKQRPAADIWLTAQGYGELLSPSSASGVAITQTSGWAEVMPVLFR